MKIKNILNKIKFWILKNIFRRKYHICFDASGKPNSHVLCEIRKNVNAKIISK